MDIAEWLRGLGLERYAVAFRDNEIDWEALPKLTAEDLQDLGVVLGGHRRKLLEAIATLRGDVASIPKTIAAAATAERRQLTVMFCDLVGSTALSARLDPEDLREVIGAYHAAIAEVIGRFDGFVAKYMGDGVLAYFGYPQAHEDDAERAVRAGLAVVAAVRRSKAPVPLRMRVGLATGLVVVGDLIGSGAAREEAVVGETPNLAARLQALAEPDSVVIADNTQGWSAACSSIRASVRSSSKGCRRRFRPSVCSAKAEWAAGSRRYARARRRWLAGRKNSSCYSAVGSWQEVARAASC
jgi:class 3 adenylate cyclase